MHERIWRPRALRALWIGALGWCLGWVLAAPVAAAPLFYLVSADSDQVRVVDGADASTVSATTMSLGGPTIEGATGLARNPQSGVLYALLKLAGQSGRELVTVDPGSGATSAVGDTGLKLAGLAFDAGGTLYGINGDQAFSQNPQDPETLFTLSLVDATPTPFLELGNGDDGETIAYRPDDGLLYHASGTHLDQVFETVDLGSHAVTDIPLSGDAYTEAGALGYAGAGLFYMGAIAFDDPTGVLYTLDDGGLVTSVGPLDVAQPKGLVLVPEPATALLLAGALALLAARRR